MSMDDTESDHDYATIRLRNIIANTENLRVIRLMRDSTGEWSADPEQSTYRRTDHNYIFQSGGNMEDDQDIFDDESTEAGNDIPNSDSTSVSYETDTISEDSISTITTNTSDQTQYSEQSNLTERSNTSELTTFSSTSVSDQSEREPPNNSADVASTSSNAQQINLNSNSNAGVINLDTPTPPKKRKRLSLENNATPKVKSNNEADLSDEDDGLTCPICLDNWEMSGEHRLASLKCGHLFGDSCIRRWLQESSRQSGQKVCPQCKTKAHPKDIRFLYAKRLRAIDRSEEHRMREQLTEAQSKTQKLTLELTTFKMSYAQVNLKVKALKNDIERLTLMIRNGGGSDCTKLISKKPSMLYKLFLDRNIEISKEPGCRVLKYAELQTSIIVSQKSTQNLFPGYGLRFVDTSSFKPTNFLFTSHKLVRDISLSDDQQLLVAASMEPKVKLFDLRTLSVSAIFSAAEKPIWSCSLGQRNNEHFIYLGSQHGSTYIYDIRMPETFISDHQSEGDLSPVIQVAPIPICQMFPCGGFLVCKLTSMWLYEHSGASTHSTRLPLEGRFISMDFDAVQLKLLVQTRSCPRYPRARYILGYLNKINDVPVFEMNVTFFASSNSPVMARSSQISIDKNTLVAAYIQDSKLLSIYDANREQCIQSLPAQDIIYDTCPIYTKDVTFLAALTETKCRLYKLNST